MNKAMPITGKGTLLLAFCLLLVLFSVALAQSGDGYELIWGTAVGGGGSSTGGPYALGGTAGQSAAGALTGGGYTLVGGGGVNAPLQHGIFMPLVGGG